MRSFVAVVFAIVLTGMLFTSCSTTRRLSSGEYLLRKTEVKIAHPDYDSIKVARENRITAKELAGYERQTPNKRFLGISIGAWIYSMADPVKDNWWHNTTRRVGSAPIILDTVLTEASAETMKMYMDSRGYLTSDVWYRIDTSNRKARVTYYANPDFPYTIASFKYEFRDDFLSDIILEDTASTLIRVGDPFDKNVLTEERNRITNYLRNRGYYDFSANDITYSVDTTLQRRQVSVTMIVHQHASGRNSNGDQILDNNKVYRIRDIYVFPDYDPTATSDPAYSSRLDTIYYRGLNIIYENHPEIREEVIRSAVNLFPNSLYDASQVRRTYNNLMLLGYYRSANIQFRESEPDSTFTDNRIVYVGDLTPDSTRTEISLTEESYLTCNIYLSPQKKQNITAEFEGTTTSDYYGLMLRLGYQNRNIFRGAELLDIGFRGGYEFLRNNTGNSSFELGGSASVTFPRFLAPFGINRYNRIFNPKTRAEVAYNIQQRPYYRRTISSGAWSYSWGNGRNSSFILRPIDINVIKMGTINADFLESITNPYLKESYKSQVVAGLSGSFIFNNQMRNVNSNYTTLRINFETNGNLLNGIFSIFDGDSDDPYRIFGTQFAQYFRVDANIARKIAIGDRSSIVYRFYGGWALNYGNGRSIPFDRFFYSGGLNSMRGWVSRTLGPGNAPRPTGENYYPSQVGNLKLEANLEGRFPIMGIVNGAVFFDLGNVWWTGNRGYISTETGKNTEESQFRFNTFYKQLGFNTGLGVRLDFNLFIFRLDWGLQLHNPNMPAGERWIDKFGFKYSTLSFGVGYPF